MKNLKKIKSIKMRKGRYSLRRVRDGAGDSGMLLQSYKEPKGAKYHSDLVPDGENGELKIGNWVECGSPYARTYSAQDFWRCTPIKEFLEIKKDENGEVIYVRFMTRNSEYEVESF